jgi:hypothetical protein
MAGDDYQQVTRSADVALEVLVRAYHALAVIYELATPGAYTALHGKIMPYLLDSFCHETADGAGDARSAELYSRALERVRCVLDDVQTDVAAVRIRGDERNH